jgi:hypothetical protein
MDNKMSHLRRFVGSGIYCPACGGLLVYEAAGSRFIAKSAVARQSAISKILHVCVQ